MKSSEEVGYGNMHQNRELDIVENKRLVCLLDLTVVFGVKTIAKLTPIFKLQEKSKTGRAKLPVCTLSP